MKRDLAELVRRAFDLVVIGGGIFGVAAARDAALRGLSVALLERGDFAHATSGNSFRMVHGGIRYLQHADLARLRESSRERTALLRTAPHLVHPLPIVIPTYGRGKDGKALLRLGCLAYDILTLDRNRGLRDPARRIPPARTLARSEVLDLFPGLPSRGLTGGVEFSDAQIYHPARLALACARSAAGAGAVTANYVEVTGFLGSPRRVEGVRARDVLGGDDFEVRAKVVLNASGPWAERLVEKTLGLEVDPPLRFSRDACFVVPRNLVGGERGLALLARTSDPDAILGRKRRHLFVVPWREHTLVGVWHVPHRGEPGDFTVTEGELQEFIDEVNEANPALSLTLDDVCQWNAGLVLFGRNAPGAKDLSYGKRSRIVDHAREGGAEGLITLVGVRYTTARREAARVVDRVFRKLGRRPPRSRTRATPIYGGDIRSIEDFVASTVERAPAGVGPRVLERLARNHGTAAGEVLELLGEDPSLQETIGDTDVIGAEVTHAVREEMAVKLADAVFRRTDLGIGRDPGDAVLRRCAELMAAELGWSAARIGSEVAEAAAAFPRPQAV